MNSLFKKTLEVLKTDGIRETLHRTGAHLSRKLSKRDSIFFFTDILFITDCESLSSRHALYRVRNQREQLETFNCSTSEVMAADLDPEWVKFAHVFILVHCSFTVGLERFITTAQSLNKKVIFDADAADFDRRLSALCDVGIAANGSLAQELRRFVPEVFINRNTASEKMLQLANAASEVQKADEVRLGYFSEGENSCDNFGAAMPAVIKMLKKSGNLRLYVFGKFNIPEELKPYSAQILMAPLPVWYELPKATANLDILIVPLEKADRNDVKNRNLWIEASLMKVVTVTSNSGASDGMIKNGETGFLCDDPADWDTALDALVRDRDLRKNIAGAAYEYVLQNCLTINTGRGLADWMRKVCAPSAAFCLQGTDLSGGVIVALKHACLLRKNGFDTSFIVNEPSQEWMEYEGQRFPVIKANNDLILAHFDTMTATFWSTVSFVEGFPRVKKHCYLVQGYETDFYQAGKYERIASNRTYNIEYNLRYITISKWCQKWLKEKFGKEAAYAPNGIDLKTFYPLERKFNGKIRILVEGDSESPNKKVDESFEICSRLDPEKYEIWYLSYHGKPNPSYRVEKVFQNIPHNEVASIYRQCHILIKSSILESFSYPPLEMMATGGCVVVVQNEGNSEYIKDGINCLTYPSGDIERACELVEKIACDEDLRRTLSKNGIETAKKYDWDLIEDQILALYDPEGWGKLRKEGRPV